jgi:predicted DNA-binding transcriptional regulator AlpA
MGLIVLSKRKAAERDNISLRHLERLIANGEGPPLVRLGPRRVGIIEEDNDAWVRSRRSPHVGGNAADKLPAATPTEEATPRL